MPNKSFSFSTDFYRSPHIRGVAEAWATWLSDGFFPGVSTTATAEVTHRSFDFPNGWPTIYVGFFSPDNLAPAPKLIDKRLFLHTGTEISSEKSLLRAFRAACNIVWDNPRYLVSEPQREGKWNEILLNWFREDHQDQLFPVDVSHYYFENTRPIPWTSTFPMDSSVLVYFRLGQPLVERRFFSVFQKRRPRISGRSDRPAWREVLRKIEAGRKFRRWRKKLEKNPNGKGFGNEWASNFRGKLKDFASSTAAKAAQSAANEFIKKHDPCANKGTFKKRLNRAINAKLKEMKRKR